MRIPSPHLPIIFNDEILNIRPECIPNFIVPAEDHTQKSWRDPTALHSPPSLYPRVQQWQATDIPTGRPKVTQPHQRTLAAVHLTILSCWPLQEIDAISLGLSDTTTPPSPQPLSLSPRQTYKSSQCRCWLITLSNSLNTSETSMPLLDKMLRPSPAQPHWTPTTIQGCNHRSLTIRPFAERRLSTYSFPARCHAPRTNGEDEEGKVRFSLFPAFSPSLSVLCHEEEEG